jgi:hypothetical protein
MQLPMPIRRRPETRALQTGDAAIRRKWGSCAGLASRGQTRIATLYSLGSKQLL